MRKIRSTLISVWQIAKPYFSSEDKWAARGLLAAVIAIELAIVAINVMITQWNARFYNALQDRNWDSFVYELGYFSVLVAIFVVLAVYQLYLNQWLQIRWRRWMTTNYLGGWLAASNHYRMQLTGDAADNPDQRVTEDVELFVTRTLELGVGLLSSVVTIGSYLIMLWALSAAAPLTIGGREINLPGYLIWGALIYSIAGTLLTHYIGAPLVALNFQKQRYEADFRFNLVRVRENAEQIALLHGEAAERQRLGERFRRVVDNWLALMSRTKKLRAFTASYDQAAVVFPFILVAPAYFAQKIQIGEMMQTASAFTNVQTAMSFLISSYRTLAEWRAVVDRLEGFEAAIVAARATGPAAGPGISRSADAGRIALSDLHVTLPDGKPLVTADDLTLRRGQSALVTGPSGSGKSTLFRAIAGIWPFGKGSVSIPANADPMMLPQRPYFPVGTLRAAIAYPSEADTYTSEKIGEAIAAVGLPALVSRLDEDAHWNRMLSLGEQQRLAIARALLHAPAFLFLDEATASLDEPSETALYELLAKRLPDTTVISIGHRSTLTPLHERKIALTKADGGFTLQDVGAS